MQTFIQKFAEKITGTLECFDRVIFKGHLMKLSFAEGMETFLAQQGLRIKDFGRFVRIQSDQLVLHAKMTASKAQRPYRYLPGKIRKDDEARRIAQQLGITQGLICVFSELETCPTFKIAYGQGRPRIQFARRQCLCLYTISCILSWASFMYAFKPGSPSSCKSPSMAMTGSRGK